MADTTTTNKGYTKPELGTTGWGSKINTNLDSIDSDINDIETDKVNKVIGGTSGNLAGVDANGDLTDSGYVVVDQDDMAANSNTKVPTQQSVKAYVDDTVAATNEVVEDTTPQLGGDLDTNNSNINFGDNDKAQFGASDDLQIYHDGSNSYVQDAGAGSLILNTTNGGGVYVYSAGETMATFNSNGAVNLYYDNSTKLATTSTGIDVTGSVTCDGFTSTGIDDNATSTAITIDASENTTFAGSATAPNLIASTAVYSSGVVYGSNTLSLKKSNGTSYVDFDTNLKATFAGDVTVGTGNLVIGTSGKGIDFSADGNAAGMTSEVLDDYETGTFTPTMLFGGASVGVTYSQQYGFYTKIGDMVHCTIRLVLTAKGTSTGAATSGGLPFANKNTAGNYPTASMRLSGVSFADTPTAFMNTASTAIDLLETSSAGSLSSLTNANFNNASNIMFSISYRV